MCACATARCVPVLHSEQKRGFHDRTDDAAMAYRAFDPRREGSKHGTIRCVSPRVGCGLWRGTCGRRAASDAAATRMSCVGRGREQGGALGGAPASTFVHRHPIGYCPCVAAVWVSVAAPAYVLGVTYPQCHRVCRSVEQTVEMHTNRSTRPHTAQGVPPCLPQVVDDDPHRTAPLDGSCTFDGCYLSVCIIDTYAFLAPAGGGRRPPPHRPPGRVLVAAAAGAAQQPGPARAGAVQVSVGCVLTACVLGMGVAEVQRQLQPGACAAGALQVGACVLEAGVLGAGAGKGPPLLSRQRVQLLLTDTDSMAEGVRTQPGRPRCSQLLALKGHVDVMTYPAHLSLPATPVVGRLPQRRSGPGRLPRPRAP